MALLTDYVLTVSVSVAAGVAAITSAAPGLYPYRVGMSVFFIWFIAWGNLRGVRESGRMFALPTYFFIFMMFLMLGVGLFREFTGGLHPMPIPPDVSRLTGAVTFFLILKAFASGGAAVTGVEAVSNGVPAFKPVEWKNARTTLMWMGSLLGVMFLGLSFLTVRLQILPTVTKTVISQVGRAIFGGGALGYGLFLALQAATTLILILAANTSFADFPAWPTSMPPTTSCPRPAQRRGATDSAFSNGIIGLSQLRRRSWSIAFECRRVQLIPFYAIGVFNSFTPSQAGMAKRHLRPSKSRAGGSVLAINGLGATTTGVVTDHHRGSGSPSTAPGLSSRISVLPVMVLLLVRMNRQYEREDEELGGALVRLDANEVRRPIVVLLVEAFDAKMVHALGYAKTIRAEQTMAVHIEDDPMTTLELETAWGSAGLGDIPLKVLRGHGDAGDRLAGFVGGLPADRDVNILMPVSHEVSRLERVSESRAGARLARALLPYEQVRLTLVRDHPHGANQLAKSPDGHATVRLSPRGTHTAVVLVDKLDRATLRAIRYARTLGANDVFAIHAALDPANAAVLADVWMSQHLPIPLVLVECWDRNVGRALEQDILRMSKDGTEVTVVMARRDFPKLRQRLLHDRTSRRISKTLGRYPHIDVAIVPYYIAPRPHQAEMVDAPGVR